MAQLWAWPILALLCASAAHGQVDAPVRDANMGSILEVGPGKPYAEPSAAIAAARDGDTVRVAPGIYRDCAIIRQNRFTIESQGGKAADKPRGKAGDKPGGKAGDKPRGDPGGDASGEVVMRDKSCAGKGILVIDGTQVTVRGLTLANARVPDRNGAGIRAEGGALLVENTRFLDNENGLLSNSDPTMSIRIVDSTFIGNGQCQPACAHGIYAGHIGLLRVERSHFLDQHEGHQIKSRASRTEIVGCDIRDGPEGTSSYAIDLPNGGSASIENNRIAKGRRTSNGSTAIAIGEEGDTNPPGPIVVRNNFFANEQDRTTVFIRNVTATPVQSIGNTSTGPVVPLEGPGTVR
jgi:hypothetical protein